MSDEIYAEGNLYVTRYCGPAGPEDRCRWQVTVAACYPESQFVTLDREQTLRLWSALGRDLSGPFPGPRKADAESLSKPA